jgi:methionyl-tRNA formyltransferase
MHKAMRIIFAGTPDTAATSLAHLIARGANVVGVVTRLDSRVGRSGVIQQSAVALEAVKHDIEIYKTNLVDDSCRAWIRSLEPDIGLVVAYGAIFDNECLEIPKKGWLNVHYSLLPALRGPAPVQNAILRGLTETGVTVFILDQGIDTGPIIAQQLVAIDSAENAGELLSKLSPVGAELLSSVLMELESSLTHAVDQPKHSPDDIAKKPNRQSARLILSKSCKELSDKVRAMNPEPMAWFEFEGKFVRVLKAKLSISAVGAIGNAQLVGKELVVTCGEGSLVLETVQPAGKSAMSGSDWFRGLQRQTAFFE